jgi:hypothetical protein
MFQDEEKTNVHSIPRHCSLDGFAEISGSLDGVSLRVLRPRDTIHARTRNSDYRIVLVDPEQGKVTVQGGRFFNEPVAAVVSGSTLGGCMLKLGWLGLEDRNLRRRPAHRHLARSILLHRAPLTPI